MLFRSNRGLPLRRRRGQGPHLAKRWEPRGFSRVAALIPSAQRLVWVAKQPLGNANHLTSLHKRWEGSALEMISSPSSDPQLGCVWASPEALSDSLVLGLNPESHAMHLVTLWAFQFFS